MIRFFNLSSAFVVLCVYNSCKIIRKCCTEGTGRNLCLYTHGIVFVLYCKMLQDAINLF